MTIAVSEGITDLLLEWRSGDASALERLIPLVYNELRKLARQRLRREKPNRTLETTGLVNEAYLRLVRSSRVQWRDRAHFFAVAAQLMRRVLVDEARRRHYQKRGGEVARVSLEDADVALPERELDLVALDVALEELSHFSPRKARVVEMRFFGGLTIEETAAVLEVSADIVKREWRTARLWLLQAISGNQTGSGLDHDHGNRTLDTH